MKSHLRRAGIIGAFLLLIYVIIYTSVSWRAGRSFPEGPTDQEVVRRKLDRIEQTLNKLGESQLRRQLKKTFKLFLVL